MLPQASVTWQATHPARARKEATPSWLQKGAGEPQVRPELQRGPGLPLNVGHPRHSGVQGCGPEHVHSSPSAGLLLCHHLLVLPPPVLGFSLPPPRSPA